MDEPPHPDALQREPSTFASLTLLLPMTLLQFKVTGACRKGNNQMVSDSDSSNTDAAAQVRQGKTSGRLGRESKGLVFLCYYESR